MKCPNCNTDVINIDYCTAVVENVNITKESILHCKLKVFVKCEKCDEDFEENVSSVKIALKEEHSCTEDTDVLEYKLIECDAFICARKGGDIPGLDIELLLDVKCMECKEVFLIRDTVET